MTRFARAKGSKSSNEKKPEDATPWSQMQQAMLSQKSGPCASNFKSLIDNANVFSHKDELVKWASLGNGEDASDGILLLRSIMRKEKEEEQKNRKLQTEEKISQKKIKKVKRSLSPEVIHTLIKKKSVVNLPQIAEEVKLDSADQNDEKSNKKKKKKKIESQSFNSGDNVESLQESVKILKELGEQKKKCKKRTFIEADEKDNDKSTKKNRNNESENDFSGSLSESSHKKKKKKNNNLPGNVEIFNISNETYSTVKLNDRSPQICQIVKKKKKKMKSSKISENVDKIDCNEEKNNAVSAVKLNDEIIKPEINESAKKKKKKKAKRGNISENVATSSTNAEINYKPEQTLQLNDELPKLNKVDKKKKRLGVEKVGKTDFSVSGGNKKFIQEKGCKKEKLEFKNVTNPDKWKRNRNDYQSQGQNRYGENRGRGRFSEGNTRTATEMFINGEKVLIVQYDGFQIKQEDAERLEKLRYEMKEKGLPMKDIQGVIKLERRKAEKSLARLRKSVCFNCRKSGHNLSDCPEVINTHNTATGICYKCGSTEHTAFHCKVAHTQNFRFAKCFICQEAGHIAQQCPDNPRGLYPKGGACNVCGEVTHLKKNCPQYLEQKNEETVMLGIRNDRSIEGLEEEDTNSKKISMPTKKNRHVKF